MSLEYYIKAKIHTTGTHHEAGYCSDPSDFCDIDRHTTEILKVPNKKFIKEHCNSDGEIDWDGLAILSTKEQLCNGSGYCGCEVRNNVTKATLKKRRNIKDQFMAAESSDDENEDEDGDEINSTDNDSNLNATLATYPVNAFRGRFNSTYTANPGWYNNSCQKTKTKTKTKSKSNNNTKFDDPVYQERVGKIPCNRGTNCYRKHHPSKPCYYNHD